MSKNPLGIAFLRAFILTNISDFSPLFWSQFSSLSLPHCQNGVGHSNMAIPIASVSVALSIKRRTLPTVNYHTNASCQDHSLQLHRVRASLHACKDLRTPLLSGPVQSPFTDLCCKLIKPAISSSAPNYSLSGRFPQGNISKTMSDRRYLFLGSPLDTVIPLGAQMCSVGIRHNLGEQRFSPLRATLCPYTHIPPHHHHSPKHLECTLMPYMWPVKSVRSTSQ